MGSALATYILWGVLPIYWRQLESTEATELVCHRVVWSFISLAILMPILARRGWWGGGRAVLSMLREPRGWAIHSIAAVVIGTNWLTFIWAVNHGRVLEVSLAYYITPLFNILLGVVVLGERLRWWQWTAVAVAAIGVAVMAIGSGGLPWLSIVLATTFTIYGLAKKKAHLPTLVGLMMEVTVLLIPAAIYLALRFGQGDNALQGAPPLVTTMLLLAGVVTVTPLALFAIAVRRVDLSLIGILQYISPTLHFLIGAVLYGEPLDQTKIIGFVFVWIALIVFITASRRPRGRTRH